MLPVRLLIDGNTTVSIIVISCVNLQQGRLLKSWAHLTRELSVQSISLHITPKQLIYNSQRVRIVAPLCPFPVNTVWTNWPEDGFSQLQLNTSRHFATTRWGIQIVPHPDRYKLICGRWFTPGAPESKLFHGAPVQVPAGSSTWRFPRGVIDFARIFGGALLYCEHNWLYVGLIMPRDAWTVNSGPFVGAWARGLLWICWALMCIILPYTYFTIHIFNLILRLTSKRNRVSIDQFFREEFPNFLTCETKDPSYYLKCNNDTGLILE